MSITSEFDFHERGEAISRFGLDKPSHRVFDQNMQVRPRHGGFEESLSGVHAFTVVYG